MCSPARNGLLRQRSSGTPPGKAPPGRRCGRSLCAEVGPDPRSRSPFKLFCSPCRRATTLRHPTHFPPFATRALGGWAAHQGAPPKPTPRTQITVAGPSRSGRSNWQREAQLLVRLRVWAGAASVTPPPPGRSAWQPHVTPFLGSALATDTNLRRLD
jgi:hypothetical protein